MLIKRTQLPTCLLALLCLSVFNAPAVAAQCNAFHIQVLATSIPAKAEYMKKRFVDGGFDVNIMEAESNGKPLYRLRLGPYNRREAAVQAKASLTAEYNDSIIVTTTAECKQPMQTTQCYKDLSAGDGQLYAMELTITGDKVSGYYLETHQDLHSAVGKYNGVLTGSKIQASRTILVEGDVQTENVEMMLGVNTVKIAGNTFQAVACSSIKNDITAAKEDINAVLNRADNTEDRVISSDGDVYYVTYNKYGAVIRSWNGVMLYAGKNCDTYSTLYGKGTWGFANGGFNLTFEKKNFGFPRQMLSMSGIDQCRY